MTISICLTGCSVPSDFVADKNHPSQTSQTKDTSTENLTTSPSQPTPTESVTATKPSSSQSEGSATNYSQYIHKIWIDHSQMKSEDQNMSFYISSITKGKLVGKCTINGLHAYCWPPSDYAMGADYADLTGTIKNGIAICDYDAISSNARGTYQLTFKSEREIEVFSPILSKSYKYEPYTLKDEMDLQGLILNKNQSFAENLNSWGNVNFVSGEIENYLKFYLTNEEGDMLYDFDYGVDMDTDIKVIRTVSFQDVNKDGLKDIIIIAASNNDSSKVKAEVILQQAGGLFDVNVKLNKEINNSGNYKDVKAITYYLSKKF